MYGQQGAVSWRGRVCVGEGTGGVVGTTVEGQRDEGKEERWESVGLREDDRDGRHGQTEAKHGSEASLPGMRWGIGRA